MTVSYLHKVLNSNNFGSIWKLLFKWHGSVYKLVWPEFVVYMTVYYILSFVYRFVLQEESSKEIFEKIAKECNELSKDIPVSFVLGFYVSLVVSRWWDMFSHTPWPDTICIHLYTAIQGKDKHSRVMRHTIARYLNLAFILTYRLISSPAQKRFPTLDHLIEAGVLEENEKKILLKHKKENDLPKYFIPLAWAGSLVKRARRDELIKDDYTQNILLREISEYRKDCGSLISYDWINIPLVYTQVVTWAMYTYFMAISMGHQFLDRSKDLSHSIDYYIPIFSILQFLFYMGWLKVAEVLLNPFGEDDDDFETNYLVDRNMQISYLIADDLMDNEPDILKDAYWDCIPKDPIYTVNFKEPNLLNSQGALQESDSSVKEKDYSITENNKNIKNMLLLSSRNFNSPMGQLYAIPFGGEDNDDINSPVFKARYRKIQRNVPTTVHPAQAIIRNLTARKVTPEKTSRARNVVNLYPDLSEVESTIGIDLYMDKEIIQDEHL